jgi:hypothetical protein
MLETAAYTSGAVISLLMIGFGAEDEVVVDARSRLRGRPSAPHLAGTYTLPLPSHLVQRGA